jgi:uncharacterized FAD-dependent dehydrogenase
VLRLSELKLPLDHGPEDLEAAICRRLGVATTALISHRLVKRSVDARRKDAIALVYSLDLELDLDPAGLRRLERRFANDPHLRPAPESTYRFVARFEPPPAAPRPVVVGAGPCGYFAALLLAQMGLRPLLLERGKAAALQPGVQCPVRRGRGRHLLRRQALQPGERSGSGDPQGAGGTGGGRRPS